ncbi:MAG: ATP-binding protein [Candidatus Riflebacteria bacterium]|nr:ATP-binding protein [Candidatus Riflebacteria bacterium]
MSIAQLMQEPRPRSTRLDLEIAGTSRSLSLVRRLLDTCTRHQRLQPQVLNDVKLAVAEACTNVIRHAFQFDPTRRFGLNIQVSDRYFLVQLQYEDARFDPGTIPQPDLNNLREGGLGVYIMRHIMDVVEYATDPPTRTVTLRMMKRISPDDAGGQSENRYQG